MAAMPTPISISPETMGGAPVFTGTRVPIKAMFDYLEAGEPLDEFLKQFPTVSRAKAIAVLQFARATAANRIGRAA